MADETGGLAHLHPDDRQWLLDGIRSELSAVFEASARAPATTPPPGRPPADYDGMDARQFDLLRKNILHDLQNAMREATADFLPEADIEKRLSGVSSTIDQRFDTFKRSFLDDVRTVVKEEVEKLQTAWFKIFADLKMPLDEGEKRVATRDKLSDLFAMQDASKQWKSEFWKAIRTTSITAIVTAIGAFFTYLFTRGGPSH